MSDGDPSAAVWGPLVTRAELRDFRNYGRATAPLADGLTVVCGENGAGKSNLLEAIYFAGTGRSPRTANERELVRRGAPLAHVALDLRAPDGAHRLEVGFAPGDGKRMKLDGSQVESFAGAAARPLMSVFVPERLELVKGPPAARRAHLDQVIAALWPARAETRTAYLRALAQRNALVARIRAGASGDAALAAWDAELGRHGIELIAHRSEAVDRLGPLFIELATRLGLPGEATLRYRPRSTARDADELVAELTLRRDDDIRRGFTSHGPHRDDLQLLLDNASLRAFGSQGQQRAALLALLLAERVVIAEHRGRAPLLLLDDVMSELDVVRRELLCDLLRSGGQAVVTATEEAHVPVAGGHVIDVRQGQIECSIAAAAV